MSINVQAVFNLYPSVVTVQGNDERLVAYDASHDPVLVNIPDILAEEQRLIAKVTAFYNSGGGGDPTGGAIALFRNGSNIVDLGSQMYSSNNAIKGDAGIYFLDAPSSTSSLNYEIYFKKEWGGNQFCHDGNSPSSIILMEVA